MKLVIKNEDLRAIGSFDFPLASIEDLSDLEELSIVINDKAVIMFRDECNKVLGE